MNKLFTEFENENSLREYPFASGCTAKDTKGTPIGVDVLIDAVLYPINPKGTLYLSQIGSDGVISISDEKSVVMTASISHGSSTLEFYDLSPLKRHVGTIVASSPESLEALTRVYEDRKFKKDETEFASSCVFPVVNDGVLSLNVGSTGVEDGVVRFNNADSDMVRISTNSSGNELRFDVIPDPEPVILTSIQHIYCIVDGKTPFRIKKFPYANASEGPGNTVEIYLDNIDRQDICNNSNRKDTLEMKDTCGCGDSPCDPTEPPVNIPDVYQVEVVDIPNKADSAFYLAVPNMTGYDNPLSLTMEDGATEPTLEVTADPEKTDNTEQLKSKTKTKAVVLQVPGLEPTL